MWNNERVVSGGRSRSEPWLAAFLFAIPLLYLLTESSWAPVLWHYSLTLLAAIAGYGVLYALVLLSYRRSVPAALSLVRTYAVAAGFTLFAAFLASEAVLAVLDERPDVETRRLRGYEPDPDLGYRYRPNYEQDVITLEANTHWRSNALGLRANRDYGPKPPGVRRILALGDSFTVATAVELEESWPGVLQRRLNEAVGAGAFEVINAGHAGWGTMQQARWYEKFGAQLEPDLVLVAITPNDISDNGAEPPGYFTAVKGVLAYRNSGGPEYRLWKHRQNWYSLRGQLERSHLVSRAKVAWQSRSLPQLIACRVQLDEEAARLHELTEGFLLDIRDRAAGQGASVGLLAITFQEQLGEMAEGYAPGLFGERWLRFARRNGMAGIDTRPYLLAHPDPGSLFWRWDGHYTVEGSRVAGDVAFELVANMLGLAGTPDVATAQPRGEAP